MGRKKTRGTRKGTATKKKGAARKPGTAGRTAKQTAKPVRTQAERAKPSKAKRRKRHSPGEAPATPGAKGAALVVEATPVGVVEVTRVEVLAIRESDTAREP